MVRATADHHALAEHHGQTAEHHLMAAHSYASGDMQRAGHHAHIARGHAANAGEHSNLARMLHAAEHKTPAKASSKNSWRVSHRANDDSVRPASLHYLKNKE